MPHDVDDRWETAEARMASYTKLNIIIVESTQFVWNCFTHVVNKFSTKDDNDTSDMHTVYLLLINRSDVLHEQIQYDTTSVL